MRMNMSRRVLMLVAWSCNRCLALMQIATANATKANDHPAMNSALFPTGLGDVHAVQKMTRVGGKRRVALELSASTTIADVKASVQRQEGIRPEHLEVFSLEGMSPLPECAQVLGPCTLIARVDTSENLVHYILAKMFTTKESDIGLPAFNESHQLVGFYIYCEKATEHGASSVFKLPFHFAELRPNAARILNRHLLVNIHKRSKTIV